MKIPCYILLIDKPIGHFKMRLKAGNIKMSKSISIQWHILLKYVRNKNVYTSTNASVNGAL